MILIKIDLFICRWEACIKYFLSRQLSQKKVRHFIVGTQIVFAQILSSTEFYCSECFPLTPHWYVLSLLPFALAQGVYNANWFLITGIQISVIVLSICKLLTITFGTPSKCVGIYKINKSVALQPRRVNTDWSGCSQIAVQGALWLAKRLSLNLNFSFLNRISLLLIQLATQSSSWGWVDPVPDPTLPEKFLGYSGNLTRESWMAVRRANHYSIPNWR